MKNRFLFSSHFLFSLILSVSLALSISPSTVFAFGFGEVKLFSYLDEPLDAEVELLGTENFDPSRILVTLASAQEFKKAGLARPFLLSNLHFQVERRGQNTVVRITSSEAIHQPYLEYLIDLSWPGGRLVRGYTLLLDPAPAGTLPLHERRPQVKHEHPAFNEHRAFNEQNALNQHSALNEQNALNEQRAFKPNEVFTNNSTPAQTPLAPTANAEAHGSLSRSSNTYSNTHQERFERLFEEKTAEAMSHETPPMTIVSTMPASKQENMIAANQYSTQYPTHPSQPQAANNHASNGYSQGAYPYPENAKPQAQYHAKQHAMQNQNYAATHLNEEGISLNKTKMLIAIASFSILTLFIALFIIISRKNKKDFNLRNFFARESRDLNNLSKNTSNLTNMPFQETNMSFQETDMAFQETGSGFLLDEALVSALAGDAKTSASASVSALATDAKTSASFNPAAYSVNYPAAEVPPVQNEMVMKLELARNYLGIEDQENGLRLLQDVLARGNDWEKSQAQKLLHDVEDKQLQH